MLTTYQRPSAMILPGGLYQRGGKRALDLVLAAMLLALFAPVIIVVALTVRLTLGPSILLHQRRVGLGGTDFDCLKFRTMQHCRRAENCNSVSHDGPDRRLSHKRIDDPRHTAIGRLLRKYSVDELPQLLNVLLGHMSIVGPRPELASCASADFRRHERHLVRPGLTGLFQISPLRGNGELQAGLAIDRRYVQTCTLVTDLGVVVRTAKAVVCGTGN